ncbi:Repetin [Streptomyces sp. CMB-StM0423]|uniref:Repetin n=1 Tax=Streptomyces sp. CMB-StM0423 TaxID=2059884 RepID=UPI000C7023E4|nr:Repetin [Streptomyces sp. CMB-StM0423]AUH41934.1 Repetin [Streptomyces sp. CMB-StM0423]
MRHVRSNRLRAVALSAALLATATAGTAAAAGDSRTDDRGGKSFHSTDTAWSGDRGERPAASLTGTAKLTRSLGDDITFSFDARLAAKHNDDPLQATGTFRFSHYLGGEGAWAEADVDCLVTGGRVAVVSGVITDTDLPGAKGLRVGVTVHDQGRNDRLGYSWAGTGSPVEDKDLAPCVSSAPFEKVKRGTGDFRVQPWQPEL